MNDNLECGPSTNFYEDLSRQISEILNRDLFDYDNSERSIDLWMKEYGLNGNYKETKEMLLLMRTLVSGLRGSSELELIS